MRCSLALMPVWAVLECCVLDIVAAGLMPAMASRMTASLKCGFTAFALARSTLGSGWAVIYMMGVVLACLTLPMGAGLPGLILLPVALFHLRKYL